MNKRLWGLGLGVGAALFVASGAAAEPTFTLPPPPPSPHYEKAALEIPCTLAAKGHLLPSPDQKGDVSVYQICNGSAYQVFESAGADPVRKGIGTDDPKATLDVNGAVRIGHDPAPCTPAKAGSLRWTGKAFEGCDGAAWLPLATGKGTAP